MNKILSQDEVDALLKGVKSGEIDTETAKNKIVAGVRPYDFTNQERIVRGRMPGLENVNEKFARLLRNSISNLIMKFVNTSVQNTEVTKFSDFMKIIPFPSSITIFKMEPLKGYALLVIEAPLVFAFVEFFFGSSTTQHIKSEGRAFTSIEQRVIKKITDTLLNDMSSAWNAIEAIKPETVSFEMNPQFVTIVTPSEIVVKIEFSIEIETYTGKFFFCIPYSVLEPIKEKLYSGIQGEKLDADKRWIKKIKEILIDSSIEVSAEIGRTELSFEDLINLEIGSVINLSKSVSDELVVKIEDIPKFMGTPGYSRGSQAIRITKIL